MLLEIHQKLAAKLLVKIEPSFQYHGRATLAKFTSCFAVVTIWEHIEPVNRGIRYVQPLENVFSEKELRIVGEDSSFTTEFGVEYVNIEMELASPSLVPKVTKLLEDQGAPKGSELKYTKDGKELVAEFGKQECLAVFLDGVNLPEEVYHSTDIEELVAKLLESAAKQAEFRASWAGDWETSIHFFGRNAESMYRKMELVLKNYPLCGNARVVIRRGNKSQNPREFRIPIR